MSKAIEEIQKLTKALEEGGYGYDSPPVPVLQLHEMKAFNAALTPEAKALFQEPKYKGAIEPGMACLQKIAQWPLKEWYEVTMAKFFNTMVAKGDVRSVFSANAIQLATGGATGPFSFIDNGPDQYGLIFIMFYSPLTKAELEEKYETKSFAAEGEINQTYPKWHDLNSGPRTLAEYISQEK